MVRQRVREKERGRERERGREAEREREGEKERDRNSSFLHLFVLFRPLMDWMLSTHFGEGDLFTQSAD